MVKAIVNPTNAQLEAYKLQRPRFYSLLHNPKVHFRGWMEPCEVEGQERWCVRHNDTTTPVSLDDLRRARMYVRNSYMTNGETIYLFIYTGYGGDKYYYMIPRQYFDVWMDEERRMRMLDGEYDEGF